MKPNNLKHSMLTVGVIAALGLTQSALAVETNRIELPSTSISNVATAKYSINGTEQPTVTSNEVVVNVTSVVNFSLTDDNNKDITPDGKVEFSHTLTNNGNTEDTYTIDVTNGAGDNFDFDKFTITVEKSDGGGTTTISSGDTITLTPNQTATIKIVANADDPNSDTAKNPTKGDVGKVTVSATSKLKPDEKLTNTDTATTKTPIFAIKKSASINEVVAESSTPIKYTITVKNEGNKDATDADITDQLPTGLAFASDPKFTISTDGSSDISSYNAGNSISGDTLTINDIDIAQGETITITFETVLAAGASGEIINYATVTDDPDDDDTTDNTITDSSRNGEDQNNTNDPTDDNDSNETDPKVTVIEATRKVKIQSNDEVTLAPNGQKVFTHDIINEGNVDENITLSTNVTTDVDEITQTIYLDTNGNGRYDEGDEAYDGSSTISLPKKTGETATTKKIFVVNTATNAEAGDDSSTTWPENTKEMREQYTITVEGSGESTAPSVTDTIYIAGLELKKLQAVDDCSSTPAPQDYTIDPKNDIAPGKCIFYKLSATNHLPTQLTDLELKDDISSIIGTEKGKVQYVDGSAQGTNGITASYATGVVTGTGNIAANDGTADVTFKVKINQ